MSASTSRASGRSWTAAWAYACAVLVGVGDGLAVLEWSPLVAVLTIVLFSGCVAAVAALVRPAPDRPGPARRAWAEDLVSGSLLAGGGAVTLLALATASPSCALLLTLTAALTAPPVVRRVRRRMAAPAPAPRHARPGPPRDTGPRSLTTAAAVRRLPDPELCMLWRQTFWQLTSRRTPDALLATVLLRQACLDELARRNPAAVHAWLESGGRASGGPEKFWVTGHSHGDADAAS
jgi:hypothetical protein